MKKRNSMLVKIAVRKHSTRLIKSADRLNVLISTIVVLTQ